MCLIAGLLLFQVEVWTSWPMRTYAVTVIVAPATHAQSVANSCVIDTLLRIIWSANIFLRTEVITATTVEKCWILALHLLLTGQCVWGVCRAPFDKRQITVLLIIWKPSLFLYYHLSTFTSILCITDLNNIPTHPSPLPLTVWVEIKRTSLELSSPAWLEM